MIRHTLALLPVAGLMACATAEGEPRQDPALAGPAVKTVGEAQSCINRTAIRNTKVRSDQVIDFEMRGGKVYRNVLTSRCPRLGFERAITYETSLSQLCRTEIIYTLENMGGQVQRGAGCSLGEFVPVEYVEDDASGE
ncbi:hypothetical protein INR77_00055 [Erythrobacter sp. SCSIO 43205]|uniref:hypothetical protein n=1 Tax=Erythrobacter sp. SCSIO 43205 TaxID=2779361 RepID=UPI001CA7F151|nr:hypothetical protein [Erythrobacter sp. SCSIO 43205]UAB78191.1 hypothetical protein INR77_00055 [Erythrobacter sp. SCSIO 43205]